MKGVDSSSVSQKPSPVRLVTRTKCGKAEEASGKKGCKFFQLKPEKESCVKCVSKNN
jgi:hypothetical protein